VKELVVISGKGGTGKTSIVASFAALAQNAVLADCDVDAADLHLILRPNIKKTTDFVGGKRARIISENCVGCGKCQNFCKFGAIGLNGPGNDLIEKTYTVDPVSCEGCKVCVEFCPAAAIEFKDCINGQWFVSDTRFGPMVHAKLGIAEENSGKLVTLIRREARQIAEQRNRDLLIIDGSPGIGCPVIASITGADMVLIVTEPTLSGNHDLQRIAQLAKNFKIPAFVCINKADINLKIAEKIENSTKNNGLMIGGRISYDKVFVKALIAQSSVIEYADGKISDEIKTLWQNIMDKLS